MRRFWGSRQVHVLTENIDMKKDAPFVIPTDFNLNVATLTNQLIGINIAKNKIDMTICNVVAKAEQRDKKYLVISIFYLL